MGRRPPIEIQIYSRATCAVLLRGEHDVSSGLGATLEMAIGSGYRNVLVDLSECTFIASSLNSALLTAARLVRERDGALELVVPADAPVVRRMLAMTTVQTVIPFHATRAAGMASVTSAEQLAGHREERARLRAVSAKIDLLQSRTESSRALQAARRDEGVTVVRAQIVAGPGSFAARAE
jgi:anti-anti-sigma factor